MTRRVEPSVFVVDRRGVDVQREYCARLIVSGWDLESAAVLSGLPLGEAQAIADDLANGAPP